MLAFEEEMKAAGAFVFSGRLAEPDTASVVRMANGVVVTTDKPFAEPKQSIWPACPSSRPDLDRGADGGPGAR